MRWNRWKEASIVKIPLHNLLKHYNCLKTFLDVVWLPEADTSLL